MLITSFNLINAEARKFWLLTYEFPGGPKTGITLINDSCLIVSAQNEVLRSFNLGKKFETVLTGSEIYSLFSTKSGKIFAGSAGKIFYSDNMGDTWDSVSVNSDFPVTAFAENHEGGIFAATGGVDTAYNLVGDGILYSGNGGLTWEYRNNGLGQLKYCDKLAVDKNGRLYIAIADESVSGTGGLYISDNNGLQWEHIDISIDGDKAIPDDMTIERTTGLTISKDDIVYLSFIGLAENTLVTLNINKSIDNVKSKNFWKIMTVIEDDLWWLDRNINNIHFARNGYWYSSVSGSMNKGGTYLKGNITGWSRIDYGLGLDINNTRNTQHFCETTGGKIFMIQYLDERIYYTDTSMVTGIDDEYYNDSQIDIYPNPAVTGGKITIELQGDEINSKISIVSQMGIKISEKAATPGINYLDMPNLPGLYYITIGNPVQ